MIAVRMLSCGTRLIICISRPYTCPSDWSTCSYTEWIRIYSNWYVVQKAPTVSLYADMIAPASGNRLSVKMHGRTYNDSVPGGYMANHAQFEDDKTFWFKKASSPRMAKPIQGRIAVRVEIGTIRSGQQNICRIGVSIY